MSSEHIPRREEPMVAGPQADPRGVEGPEVEKWVEPLQEPSIELDVELVELSGRMRHLGEGVAGLGLHPQRLLLPRMTEVGLGVDGEGVAAQRALPACGAVAEALNAAGMVPMAARKSDFSMGSIVADGADVAAGAPGSRHHAPPLLTLWGSRAFANMRSKCRGYNDSLKPSMASRGGRPSKWWRRLLMR